MTIYGGKDYSVYFNEKKVATGKISFELPRKVYSIEDYQANLHTYPLKSQVTGTISAWDRGVNIDYHSIPYKYIDAVTNKIVAKEYSTQTIKSSLFNAIGDWEFPTTDYEKVYGVSYADQKFWLYTTNIDPNASNYTVQQVGIWVKGIGTPNSSTYKLQLIDSTPTVVWDSNSDESYLYTWTTNDDAWIWSDVSSLDLSPSDVNKYTLRLLENTSTADINNCIVAYSHTLGSPPNLYSPTYTLVCNILLSAFDPSKQLLDIKVSIDDYWSIFFEGCRLQDLGREYSVENLSIDEVGFTASSWKWYQV